MYMYVLALLEVKYTSCTHECLLSSGLRDLQKQRMCFAYLYSTRTMQQSVSFLCHFEVFCKSVLLWTTRCGEAHKQAEQTAL